MIFLQSKKERGPVPLEKDRPRMIEVARRRSLMGFTLLELLVVVSIIGLLASVVMSSVATARNKGKDSAIKQNLLGARNQAQLWYENHNASFAGVCAAALSAGGILDAFNAAAAQNAFTTSSTTHEVCRDNAATWAMGVALASDNGVNYYCVDYTGMGKVFTGTVGVAIPGSPSGSIHNCL